MVHDSKMSRITDFIRQHTSLTSIFNVSDEFLNEKQFIVIPVMRELIFGFCVI